MTITTSVNKIIATGDAIQVDFPYDFIVLAESHMNVYLDGVLEDTANWSMTGLGVQAGGVVTMTTAPGSGVKVTLLRIVPNTQLTDYSAYGSFPAETHERALDLRVMEAQQLEEAGGRALKAPLDDESGFDYSLPTPVAGKSWKINATNDAIILTDGDPDQAQSDAAASVAAAQAAQAAAEGVYDNFDDRYLGAKAADPVLDNDGDALVTAALYFNTATGFKVYNGLTWDPAATNAESVAAAASAAAALVSENAASASETAAGLSETAAGLSETAAAASETAAAASETAAGLSATTATNAEAASVAAKVLADAAASSASNSANSSNSYSQASATSAAESAASAVEAAGLVATVSQISTIDKIVATTANLVDTFIYDTTKDSDGGAWRDRCSGLSWYNETLNTATRGATQKFPALALIVAGTTSVTIYDLTDDAAPMWMVFNATVFSVTSAYPLWGTQRAISMLDGLLCASSDTALARINFISESTRLIAVTQEYVYAHGIVNRNTLQAYTSDTSTGGIVSGAVNDVAITTLPTAPIDPATGLPVPTIAVATDGGVSVITDTGDVWDLTCTVSGDSALVHFLDDNRILYEFSGYNTYLRIDNIPSSDVLVTDLPYTIGSSLALYSGDHTGAPSIPSLISTGGTGKGATSGAIASQGGLTQLKENPTTPAEGMVAYTTQDYATGWMHGDIKGAWVPDVDEVSVSNPAVIPDRSVNANDITVFGTLALNPVATGAELTAFSGFSSANYLQQEYNADLDFGTGDFYVMGWVKLVSAYEVIYARKGTGLDFYIDTGLGDVRINGIGNSPVTTGLSLDGLWHFVCFARTGGNLMSQYNDGRFSASANSTLTMTSADATSRFGVLHTGGQPMTNSSLALWRIGAGAPSAEQIAHTYNTEKELFKENAACTLAGTSDSVLALDYDASTDKLQAMTPYGRSGFVGLERVESEATTVGNPVAVSAVNGNVSQAGSTAVDIYAPADNLREELARVVTRVYSGTAWGDVQAAINELDAEKAGLTLLHNENKLINGNFAINQEAVSGTVVLAAGEYGHDGFKGGAAGCTYTFATVENITTLTISAGSLIQIADGEFLQSGTHILSWSGTCQGKIDGGAYSASGVTGILTGGTNASIEFNTGTLSLVQLEKGTVSTDFEFRDDELRRCQYYFAKQPIYMNFDDVASTGAGYRSIIPHITPMKSTPTYGAFDQIVLTGWSSVDFISSSSIQGYVAANPTAVGPASRVIVGTIDADARL